MTSDFLFLAAIIHTAHTDFPNTKLTVTKLVSSMTITTLTTLTKEKKKRNETESERIFRERRIELRKIQQE